MEYTEIPQKIKDLRTKNKFSIQELAKRADLTPGYLSKIENSENPPPIPTLSKIAYALNVHISYFFDDEQVENGLSIVRENERKEIVGDLTPSGYTYHSVVHKRFDSRINPFVMTLPSGVVPATVPYNSHEGEELIYVLTGNLVFNYGDNEYYVRAGDCLYFNGNIPHRVIRETKDGDAEILSILFLHNTR
jgi:transcriptional regulator with XRE-family HTH domain